MNTLSPRVVCRACNIGWMRALDESARDSLAPLMCGLPATLTHEELTKVAAWIAMKCMVAETLNRDDMVSNETEHRFVMENARCPSNWVIRIGHQLDDEFRSGIIRCSLTMGSAPKGLEPVTPDGTFAKNTQSITIGFGRLLVYAVSSRVEGFDLDLAPNICAITRQIWPIEQGFGWPPSLGIDGNTIQMLGIALNTFIRNLPWKPAQ